MSWAFVQTQWRRGPLTVSLIVVVWLVLSGLFINAVFFSGSGSGSTYPTNEQTNFLNACEQSSAVNTSKCGCALAWLESNVSVADFQAGEATIVAGGATPDWLYKASQACSGA